MVGVRHMGGTSGLGSWLPLLSVDGGYKGLCVLVIH